jgi:hypothetical protein
MAQNNIKPPSYPSRFLSLAEVIAYGSQRKGPFLPSRLYVVVGVALILAASPLLALMALEFFASHVAYSAYAIEPVFDWQTPLTFGGRTIHVDTSNAQPPFTYRIAINGVDRTMPKFGESQVQLSGRQDKVHAAIVTEHGRDQRFTVTQVFPGSPYDMARIISIARDGNMTEEIFRVSDRRSPSYRVILLRLAGRDDIGFYSNVSSAWPSIIYPILYPFGTALVGLVFVVIGLLKRIRLRRTRLRT